MCGFFFSWYLLAAGNRPAVAFHVAILVSLILVVVRLAFLRRIISLSMRDYVRKILIPVGVILAIGCFIPIIVYLNFEEGIPRLACVFASSFVCLPLSAYAFGLSSDERSQLKIRLFNRLAINTGKA
jgi:hypothetical protein